MNIDALLTGMLSVMVAVIGYLLSSKDKAQQDEIAALQEEVKLLNAKHEVDVMALQELRVRLAGDHYAKAELDAKFDRMETTFSQGFQSLGHKFDSLSETLTQLLIKHHD